jgi:hypothetical protein
MKQLLTPSNLIIALVILVLAATAFHVSRAKPTTTNPTTTTSSSSRSSSASVSSTSSASSSLDVSIPVGEYTKYSVAKLAKASNGGHVILFFNSASCSSCSILHNRLQRSSDAIPANITILEVDYDTAAELNTKYNIKAPHFLVEVDSNGEFLKYWEGSASLDQVIREVGI